MSKSSEKSNEPILDTGKVLPEAEDCKEESTQDPVHPTLSHDPKFSLNKEASPEGNTTDATGLALQGVELNTTGTYTGESEDEMQMSEEPAIENSQE